MVLRIIIKCVIASRSKINKRRKCIMNTKLSCCRETARRFLSLNISLSHSRSLKVIRNDNLEYGVSVPISIPLCLYLVPFLRYSASNNGVTLKSEVAVVHGHWKWRES